MLYSREVGAIERERTSFEHLFLLLLLLQLRQQHQQRQRRPTLNFCFEDEEEEERGKRKKEKRRASSQADRRNKDQPRRSRSLQQQQQQSLPVHWRLKFVSVSTHSFQFSTGGKSNILQKIFRLVFVRRRHRRFNVIILVFSPLLPLLLPP